MQWKQWEYRKKGGKSPHPGGLKYWCDCEVNGSKSERAGENGSYEESEQRQRVEDISCKAGLWGAWAHNQWSEVCVLYLWRRVSFREANPIFTGSVAMLFEKISCSLRKTGEHPLRGRITPPEWTGGKKSCGKWGELPLLGDTFNWLLMIWSIIHSKERVDTSRNRLCTYSFLFRWRCECSETHGVWQKKRCPWGVSFNYLLTISLFTI